jgi:hypothetical protein
LFTGLSGPEIELDRLLGVGRYRRAPVVELSPRQLELV